MPDKDARLRPHPQAHQIIVEAYERVHALPADTFAVRRPLQEVMEDLFPNWDIKPLGDVDVFLLGIDPETGTCVAGGIGQNETVGISPDKASTDPNQMNKRLEGERNKVLERLRSWQAYDDYTGFLRLVDGYAQLSLTGSLAATVERVRRAAFSLWLDRQHLNPDEREAVVMLAALSGYRNLAQLAQEHPHG